MIRSKQLFIAFAVTALALTVLAADSVSVIVKQTSIRQNSQFYAPTVAEAEYRDQLLVLKTQNDWIKVNKNGLEGWVHLSAVSTIQSSTPSDSDGVSSKYSTDEIALAGKGFNKQVEQAYRQSKPGLNFAAVDEMENSSVDQPVVAAFQAAGKLELREALP